MFPPETKILITDDSLTMRLTIKNTLKRFGYTNLSEASDGNMGFAMLEEASQTTAPFGLVFSDYNMPDCNGVEFLKKVRAQAKYAKLPFIILSSEIEKNFLLEVAREGASNFIAKPFDDNDMKTKLASTFMRHNPG